MKEQKHDKALTDWLKGETPLSDFKTQIPEEDVEVYNQILNEVDSWHVPGTAPDYNDLMKKRDDSKKKSKQIRFSTFWKYAVAASVLFALTFFYFNYSPKNLEKYETTYGETKKVVLPDGSVATLNSSSILSFDKDDWKNNRTIALQGQCYFEVTEGKPFTVDFGDGSVAVLGTTFEVKSRANGFRVKCFSGRVAVSNKFEATDTLTKGQQVISQGQNLQKSNFAHDAPDWMSGVYLYENEELTQITEDLTFEYGLTVDGEIYDKKFTGQLPKNDLEAALQVLFRPLGISYTFEGKHVVIK